MGFQFVFSPATFHDIKQHRKKLMIFYADFFAPLPTLRKENTHEQEERIQKKALEKTEKLCIGKE